jgi:hypothetical protein
VLERLDAAEGSIAPALQREISQRGRARRELERLPGAALLENRDGSREHDCLTLNRAILLPRIAASGVVVDAADQDSAGELDIAEFVSPQSRRSEMWPPQASTAVPLLFSESSVRLIVIFVELSPA